MQQPSLQDIQDALEFISPELPRDDWVKVAMGIKNEFGDAGFDTFDNWSMAGSSYKPADAKSAWNSISVGGGVTIATVFKWASENGYSHKKEPLSPEEHKKRQQEFARIAAEREKQEAQAIADREKWHEVISLFAEQLLKEFTQPCKNNKYLKKKGVKSFGCHRFSKALIVVFRSNFVAEIVTDGPQINDFFKQLPPKDDRDFSFLHIHQNDLVIPLIDIDKKLWNLQIINETGSKLFLKHGRKSGCFHFIGKAANSDVLAVAEGYATGATIHMATNWPCAVALDAGNLLLVSKQLKEKLPDKKFVLCADNDQETKGNPGVTKATEAAKAVDGVMVAPDFSCIANKEAA